MGHRIWKLLIPILVGIGVMSISFLLAGFAGGACHCVSPTAVLFPFAAMAWGGFSWESIGTFLLALQYPVYSLTIAMVKGSTKKALAVLALLIIHAAAIAALQVYRHG